MKLIRSLVLFLVTLTPFSCRTTPNSSSLVLDAADDAKLEGDLENTLVQWKNSWKTLGITQTDWQDTYSACHKNQSGAGLNEIQRLAYCFLPVEFRVCNSLYLKKIDKIDPTDLQSKLDGFSTCVGTTNTSHIVGKDADKVLYETFFLRKGDGLNTAYKDRMIKDYSEPLHADSFIKLVDRTVQRYINQNGGYNGAEKELAKAIEPAVDNPQLVAAIAKRILQVVYTADAINNEYLFLF